LCNICASVPPTAFSVFLPLVWRAWDIHPWMLIW
jgi:hypothetical protein